MSTLTEIKLRPVVAMAALARTPITEFPTLITQMFNQPVDATLYMNQFQIFSALGNHDFALEMQAKALELNTIYRIAGSKKPAIRLLALMGPGDSTDNTPLDYLIEDSDIQLDLLYILPGHPLPDFIPEHDVAIIALGESAKNRSVLDMMRDMTVNWPRPVLNPAEHIMRCTRDEVYRLLKDIPGLLVPPTLRVTRGKLESGLAVDELIGSVTYPITLRPLDSQAGQGLSKINDGTELTAYLDNTNAEIFYASIFVDYRSADGLYRKLRIALIDGQPYICHLAIGDNWIVHYGSSGMMESAEKRREEAGFMQNFDRDFMQRHGVTLGSIADLLKLHYVVIDCAETPDGKLLLFEADNRGWVHATDPVDLFPYKQQPMRRVFTAFRAMLLNAKAHAIKSPTTALQP